MESEIEKKKSKKGIELTDIYIFNIVEVYGERDKDVSVVKISFINYAIVERRRDSSRSLKAYIPWLLVARRKIR